MNEAYYLIDNQLTVTPLADFLSKKGTWWDKGLVIGKPGKGEVVESDGGPALPITPDGNLRPGVLYESSADPKVRFYLPEYRLNAVDGRYTTRLKWRDEHDDPNGPLAFLTLDAAAVTPPAPPGLTLQEIRHQAAARIGYQMPVQESSAPSGGIRPMLWIEVGALVPVEQGARRARLPLYDKRDFDRLYQVMTDGNFNAYLEIRCFATAGRRTWRQVVLGLIDLAVQKNALEKKKVLYTNLVSKKALETRADPVLVDPNTRKVDLGTKPPVNIRWKEAIHIAGTPVPDLVKESGPAPGLSPAVTGKLTEKLANATTIHPSLFKPSVAPIASPAFLGHPTAAQPAPAPPPAAPVLNELVVQPVLERAYARPLDQVLATSDLRTRVFNTSRKAVPVKAVVDEDGRPALIQIPVETNQKIAPFWFLVNTNAYMFDIPGDIQPGTHHILIRMEVRDGAGQVLGVFYQDSAYTDQFYYQPQEFRLPRLEAPPYLPDMRIVFCDLVTEKDGEGGGAGDNEATLNYKVQLAYRVLPYIDPLLLDLAQQQVPDVQAHFNALAPQTTHLSLRVPEDETGGALTDVPRPEVEVRFDQGIVDEIELSRTEFERIFSFFQAPAGVGIDGSVEASLIGDLTARVPVRLSLKQNTGSVFGHTYLGQVNGMHRVRLVNRIESPVTIGALYRVALGGGVFAFPQAAPGQVVQPGWQLDLDYRVEPANAAVADIPPSLSVTINADPGRLWPQLFINQGYTSETFPVHLMIESDFFGVVPPGGSDPLTGVQIEFDEGTSATLTAARLQADVNLRIPLLPRLMGDAQAKKYRYRVTNLLGADAHPGARSDWMSGEGDSPLAVVPSGA